jgi:hypothetical protein
VRPFAGGFCWTRPHPADKYLDTRTLIFALGLLLDQAGDVRGLADDDECYTYRPFSE